jgi:hypothetical protein
MAPPIRALRVQRSLFLGSGEGPCSARALLLAKDEAQLLRRSELSGVGTEGGAWLGEVEGAKQIAPEEAFIARHLARATRALFSLRQDRSRVS